MIPRRPVLISEVVCAVSLCVVNTTGICKEKHRVCGGWDWGERQIRCKEGMSDALMKEN